MYVGYNTGSIAVFDTRPAFTSNINAECRLLKTLKLKSNTKKHGTLVIGEVIGIFINNKFINKGRVDSTAMRYVARMGYSEYTTVSSKFKMKRPNWK